MAKKDKLDEARRKYFTEVARLDQKREKQGVQSIDERYRPLDSITLHSLEEAGWLKRFWLRIKRRIKKSN